jgi:hypothetical protein
MASPTALAARIAEILKRRGRPRVEEERKRHARNALV